jgi:hypothetical protein
MPQNLALSAYVSELHRAILSYTDDYPRLLFIYSSHDISPYMFVVRNVKKYN